MYISNKYQDYYLCVLIMLETKLLSIDPCACVFDDVGLAFLKHVVFLRQKARDNLIVVVYCGDHVRSVSGPSGSLTNLS